MSLGIYAFHLFCQFGSKPATLAISGKPDGWKCLRVSESPKTRHALPWTRSWASAEFGSSSVSELREVVTTVASHSFGAH